MKKHLIALYFFCCLPALFWAQSSPYYVKLDDASGFNTAPYQDSLEAHAQALNLALPEAFRSQFRVYDFGFYLHQEVTDGYPDVFEKKRAEIAAITPYYLIFGKQTDKTGIYTKFWVDLNLPVNSFECLTLSYYSIITEKVRYKVGQNYEQNGRTCSSYSEAEIAGMQEFIRIINNIKNGQCCDFEPEEILEVLNGMGFVGYHCIISEQPGARPLQDQNASAIVTDHAGLNFEMYGITINSNQILSDLIANLLGQGFSSDGYITKNENLCDNNKFDEVRESYEANLNDYDIWYHVWDNPIEGEDDIVFIKSEKFDEIQSKVNVTSVPVNDGNFVWLDKATLRNYVANHYCLGCSSGSLEEATGGRFENVWHVYAESNFNPFGWEYKVYPQFLPVIGIRNTVPDGWSNSICGKGTTPTIYPGSRWYEVKAMSGTVYNSTSSGQIKSHIIAMSTSLVVQPARAANCAILGIVTPSDCTVAASVYKTGTTNKIEINHWYAQYYIDSLGRMKVQFKLYLPCFFGLFEYQVPTITINPAIL